MVILGIDPGIATTGYGIIRVDSNKKNTKTNLANGFDLIDYGCLVTDKEMKEPDRLKKLHGDMSALLEKHKPDIVAIEMLFFFRNAKTIIAVGQAKGVITLATSQSEIPVKEYAPLQIKSVLVGYGRAKKKEVEKKVKEILEEKTLKLKTGKKGKDNHFLDDAVDALAVAICHSIKIQESDDE